MVVTVPQREETMGEDYYLAQKAKLLKEFDRTIQRVQGVFVANYGEELAQAMAAESRQEFELLIPQLPYIGGRQPFTQFVLSTGWFLAMYRALQRRGGTVEEAGQLAYRASQAYLASYPAFLERFFGSRSFSRRGESSRAEPQRPPRKKGTNKRG